MGRNNFSSRWIQGNQIAFSRDPILKVLQCDHVKASVSRHLHPVGHAARQLCARDCDRPVRIYQRCFLQFHHRNCKVFFNGALRTYVVEKTGDLILEANYCPGSGEHKGRQQRVETNRTVQFVPESSTPPASSNPHSLDRPPGYRPESKETTAPSEDHFNMKGPGLPIANRTCSARTVPRKDCPRVRTPRTSPVYWLIETIPRERITRVGKRGLVDGR